MKYLSFLLILLVSSSCSVLLKDEKEIDKIIEDVVHEELSMYQNAPSMISKKKHKEKEVDDKFKQLLV